jgi:hypothetical protein
MKLALQGVVRSLGIVLILGISGCGTSATTIPTEVPQATSLPSAAPAQLVQNERQTISEAEQLAGFNVLEPSYLPKGVSLDFADYQNSPSPAATLHFKIVHEVYGDMGAFFQIMQEPQASAPPDTTSCGEVTQGCEILTIGDKQVVYRLYEGGTEGLSWYAGGFAFRLLRTAGEPNKVYKDELVHVVDSLK